MPEIPMENKNGDIIDFFTWTAHKTSSCHPEPMFVKFDNEFPVLSSKVNLAVDKKLSIQYRFLGNVPKLSMRNDKKGFVCLSGTKDKEASDYRACQTYGPLYKAYK